MSTFTHTCMQKHTHTEFVAALWRARARRSLPSKMLCRRMLGAVRRGMFTARPLACRALSTLPSLPDMSLTEVADHVVLATLDRPTRGNAFSLAMAESLLELPNVLPESTRVLIFTGSGSKAFCTGRDLAESSAVTPVTLSSHCPLPSTHALRNNPSRLCAQKPTHLSRLTATSML